MSEAKNEPQANLVAVASTAGLGPLPKYNHSNSKVGPLFTEKQMRDYAASSVAAERERLATWAGAHSERGLLREALAWIENSKEPAVSLCADIRKALGLPLNDEAHRRDAAGGPSGGADCSA